MSSFYKRFIEFCELNRQRRSLELEGGGAGPYSETLSLWQEALNSLTEFYQPGRERALLTRVLANPYFPSSMLRRLNLEEFAREPKFTNLDKRSLARIAAAVLLNRADIFLHICQDLASLNINGRVSSMHLIGSPLESLPESSWCDYCGGCCEIRGGPPEFTGDFEPPKRWLVYFLGDACKHQRFCPFLFEYFATGKFFCSIYRIKPECCWTFEHDECNFLREDVVRERVERFRKGAG